MAANMITRMKRSLVSRYLWGLSALFLGLTTLDAQADMRVSNEDINSMRIEITGVISEQDASTLAALSERLARKPATIYLDSKGGDVFAAMKIGRIIRAYEGSTWNRAICYSSCALIYIAGVTRLNFFAEIGLHRPYLASSPLSRETIEKQMPIMLARVKSYVAEMGISNTFYEQMIVTEPSKMIVYKGEAIKKIVPTEDPVWEELATAANARTYGITTLEMRERFEDMKRCPNDKNNSTCHWATLWGLSERVYTQRYDKAKRKCQFSENERFNEEETKIFWDTPTKKRLDLPFYVQFQTCMRSIMRGQ
jgi:ATP-dependent protease ClpP protease subunit